MLFIAQLKKAGLIELIDFCIGGQNFNLLFPVAFCLAAVLCRFNRTLQQVSRNKPNHFIGLLQCRLQPGTGMVLAKYHLCLRLSPHLETGGELCDAGVISREDGSFVWKSCPRSPMQARVPNQHLASSRRSSRCVAVTVSDPEAWARLFWCPNQGTAPCKEGAWTTLSLRLSSATGQ